VYLSLNWSRDVLAREKRQTEDSQHYMKNEPGITD